MDKLTFGWRQPYLCSGLLYVASLRTNLMDYEFTDIFDIPSLTRLCENYTRTNGVVTALLDLQGNIHVQTGWQDICTQFHRVNATSAQCCTESDTELASQLADGKPYNVYHCKNGLVDVAVPIHIDGIHIANLFTGQFFFEAPDQEYFKKQGERLGFDLIPYRNALDKVPIFTEDEIKRIMEFLVSLAQVIGELGKARIDLLKSEQSEREKVQELQAAKEQLEKLASEDPLTGICNRRFFNERLEQEVSRARRYNEKPLSVAMIDTDYFKVINDTHGHAVGDLVLKKIASILSESVRQSDIVARLGGDEFCVILPETDPADALSALRKISSKIAEIENDEPTRSCHVTCSIGTASLSEDCLTADDLLIHADKALYQAKAQGRNCIIEFRSTEH